jgi:nicotinate phosphoribosyltransferase
MNNGEIVPGSLPPLSEIRELAQHNLELLPKRYRQLTIDKPYPVRFSAGVQSLRQQAASRIGLINALE